MNADLHDPSQPTVGQQRDDFLARLRFEVRHMTDPEEIMKCCARMLAEHLDVDRCAYAGVEDEAVFVISGDHCRGVPSIVGRWPVAAFGAECLRLMLEDQPYVVDDVDTDPRAGSDLDAYRATTIRSVICVPLHKAGKFTAAMAVHQTTARIWTEDEIELVRAVVAGCWESLERARGDEQLREASNRLTLALLAAELGDWWWDLSTDVVTLSARASQIFGIPEHPPITWEVMQGLLTPADREPTLAILAKAVANREHYDAEYRVDRPDGTRVWISAKGRAHYDRGGAPVRMYGVIQDITERKIMEEDLRRHLAELAEADRKKDEFIALLAHELRNPLAPIRTGLEVIRQAPGDSARVSRILEMTDRQVALMARLIDDLLDVSRITAGKLSLRMERVILTKLVHDALEQVRPQMDAAGLQVTTSLPAEEVTVEGDPIRLTQVFGNLLTNSLKFTERGGKVEIRMTLRNGWIETTVEDSGIGIAPELLPRIFDRFVQAESGTSRGGLGLGLPLTRSLVEMHKGTVTAESPGLGKGSKFVVVLPSTP